MSVMTAPDYSTDPYQDLVRRIIEARVGCERLCGFPPTVIHVNGPILAALGQKGFKEGGEIAGMKIVARLGSVADAVICSRDPDLFKVACSSAAERLPVKEVVAGSIPAAPAIKAKKGKK